MASTGIALILIFALVLACSGFQMSMSGSSEKGMSRRDMFKSVTAASAAAVLSSGAPANALFGFGENKSKEQLAVEALAGYRAPVADVIRQLKAQELRGGRDDSAVVTNYAKKYFEPLQADMAQLAKGLKLAEEDQKKAETQPLLMKGHLLELAQACAAGDAKEQLEEMEEVQETLDDFLKLAATKYTVPEMLLGRAATSVEYYSIFGCEFWGLKNKPDSNVCEPKGP